MCNGKWDTWVWWVITVALICIHILVLVLAIPSNIFLSGTIEGPAWYYDYYHLPVVERGKPYSNKPSSGNIMSMIPKSESSSIDSPWISNGYPFLFLLIFSVDIQSHQSHPQNIWPNGDNSLTKSHHSWDITTSQVTNQFNQSNSNHGLLCFVSQYSMNIC